MKELLIFIGVILVAIFAFQEFAPYFVQAYQEPTVFKSIDDGETWQELLEAAKLNVLSLAVNPQNPGHVYLGTEGKGVYKSYSGGRFWNQINQGDLSGQAVIKDILIDQNNSNRVYLVAYQNQRARLIKSEDEGKTWQEVYVNAKKRGDISCAAIDSYDSAVLYLGISEGGLFKSSDYGKHWRLLDWFDDKIVQVIVNPQNTKMVYAATQEGQIYQSFDKGESWRLLSDLSEEFKQLRQVKLLRINPVQANELYLGAQYGLFSSRDGGKTWREVGLVMPDKSAVINSLAVSGQNLFYGADSVVYNSRDKGKHWQISNFSTGREISVIAIGSQSPGLIYIGTKE